jgi:hypothetical protein
VGGFRRGSWSTVSGAGVPPVASLRPARYLSTKIE